MDEPTQNGIDREELARVDRIYRERDYDHDQRYSDTNLVYLHRTQSVERAIITALGELNLLSRLPVMRILDFGCGNGRWLSRWLTWGVSPHNMAATDVRPSALECAKDHVPQADVRLIDEHGLAYPPNSFDLIYQNVVFTSILQDEYRQQAAQQIVAALKPGGVLVWYDFVYNNPNNPDVRKVTCQEFKALFPGFKTLFYRRVVLAPPLAKPLISWGAWWLADVLQTLPWLRTHVVTISMKPMRQSMGDLVVRDACLEDIDGIVAVHLVSFKEFALSKLGRSFLIHLYRCFITEFHGMCLVAEREGKVVGFVAGAVHPQRYFRKILWKHGAAFAWHILPGLNRQPGLVWSRLWMALFYRGEKPPTVAGETTCLLSSMAVDPALGNSGVGTSLMELFCELAALRGMEDVYLTTDEQHNDSVNRFYLGRGFTLIGQVRRAKKRCMNVYQRGLKKV